MICLYICIVLILNCLLSKLNEIICSGFLYGFFYMNIIGSIRFFFGSGSDRYRKGLKVIEI